jgi:hypothetical protein
VTELNLTRPATCLVDGKEVEFGKGWKTPIELRNMRWEGGGDRADIAVTSPPTEAAPVPSIAPSLNK